MNAPKLTPEEQAHVDKGGRIFIVEEIPGPLWRVLVVKGKACKVMLKPEGMDGYSDRTTALENALAFSALAGDRPRPLVRG